MSTNNQDSINYSSTFPLSGPPDENAWSVRGLPPALKRGLYILAALSLLVAAYAFANAGVHISRLPDSMGKELTPKLWDTEFYAQRKFSHLAFVALMGGLALIALARWERTVRVMRLFWLGVAHPLNLAIYRIVLFSTILFNLDDDCNRGVIKMFAGFSSKLYIPPSGMHTILKYLPVNPTLAGWSLTLMNVFCITAILGFFSRTSAFLVLVFGLYALGIPQYFGQCNHYHHMFWFTAMMVVSRTGDYFSVDAILAARRRAAGGITEAPAPARAYSLPLRCVMVILSMCYFFPGLWKYWISGLAWAWSDNFQHLMEWKWINMGEQEFGTNFTPLFRLDHYPWMYKPSAQIALIFEIGFGILIFFPRARYLAVMMGIGFHRMIAFMMRIPFYTLQTSYAAFFDWRTIFTWLGKRVFKQPMVLAYDGTNLNACKAVATLRSVDLFGGVDYIDDASKAQDGATAQLGDRTQTGATALHAAAARNPLMWVLFPLWSILLPNPAANAGRPTANPSLAGSIFRRGMNFGVIPVVIMFVIVFTPNFLLGAKKQYHSWPYACYPLFEKMRGHAKDEFEVKAFDAAGNEIAWDEVSLMRDLSKPRYSTMCRYVRENKNAEQLQAFWNILVSRNPQLKSAKLVKFLEKKVYASPERWHEAPIAVIPLGEAEVGENGAIAKVKMVPPPASAATRPTAVTAVSDEE